jgi:rhodanese-related sulfurtransferase
MRHLQASSVVLLWMVHACWSAGAAGHDAERAGAWSQESAMMGEAAHRRGPAAIVPLPEAIAPQALARALADQPQSYLLLDVRPAAAFADYHLPGAKSVTPEQAVEQARSAPAATRVVVVDRDGTIAWAVAGVVGYLQNERVVRVLDGGTARYWREVVLRHSVRDEATATDAAMSSGTQPAAKKRSAGC